MQTNKQTNKQLLTRKINLVKYIRKHKLGFFIDWLTDYSVNNIMPFFNYSLFKGEIGNFPKSLTVAPLDC